MNKCYVLELVSFSGCQLLCSSSPAVFRSSGPPVLWSCVPLVDDHAHGDVDAADATANVADVVAAGVADAVRDVELILMILMSPSASAAGVRFFQFMLHANMERNIGVTFVAEKSAGGSFCAPSEWTEW